MAVWGASDSPIVGYALNKQELLFTEGVTMLRGRCRRRDCERFIAVQDPSGRLEQAVAALLSARTVVSVEVEVVAI